MRSMRRLAVIGGSMALGVCLLLFGLRPRTPHPLLPLPPAPPPRTAAEAALRRAQGYRTRARIAVSERRSDLEAWDPQAIAQKDGEEWRLQQLSADRDGNLRAARRWAEEAAHLARTRAETYQAAELQVLLDHEMGHHDAELREAQGLIALAPGSARARMVLQRAEQCYRLHHGRVRGPDSSPGRSGTPVLHQGNRTLRPE